MITVRKVPSILNRLLSMETAALTLWGEKIPWHIWQRRARRTGKIDFGCDFKEGLCKVRRNSDRTGFEAGSWAEYSEMCCCVGCKNAVGYLGQIPVGSARDYLKYWSDKTGFWRKGKGCGLPREMRSHTCLGFNCSNIFVSGYLETGKLIHIQPRVS